MKIVFFAHPDFLGYQSMPRFTKFLADGMTARGHSIEVWSPKAKASKLPASGRIKKYLGYVDQFLVFPRQVKKQLKNSSKETLFVFTDHALGPWVPLVANKRHVIHCHDFLAQRSALNEISQNQTGWTGKLYQKFIHSGYSKGRNFISVSEKTKEDLHKFLSVEPALSRVVYNGLNQSFSPKNKEEMRQLMTVYANINLENGYILHVGGNQWYKNRIGIIQIYSAWRKQYQTNLPLILVGYKPDDDLLSVYNESRYKDDIHFLSDVSDDYVRKAYAGASVFLFPSLAEGFGWPIAEAMASGCPVITTGEVPMSEVASDAGYYVKLKPSNPDAIKEWAKASSHVLEKVLTLSSEERYTLEQAGLKNAKRFDQEEALNTIEKIYQQITEQ